MPELRAEETRLRVGGMSGTPQPSILAVRAPLLSTAPSQSPPPPSTEPQCGYCGKYRHTEDVCRKKQHEKKSRRGESSAARPVATLEQEVLTLFRRFNAVASSPSGTTARASSTPPPPPPSSGISSKWFLDSGASFHMTLDSSQLSSLSFVDPSLLFRQLMAPLFLLLVVVFFLHLPFMFPLSLMSLSLLCN